MCSGVQDPKLMGLDKFKGTTTDSGGSEGALAGPASLSPLGGVSSPGGAGTNPLGGSGSGIGAGEKTPASPKPFAGSGMAGENNARDYGNWSMPGGDLGHHRAWLTTAAGKESLARLTGPGGSANRAGGMGGGGGPLPGLVGAPKAGSLVQPPKIGLLTQPVKSVLPGVNANATGAQPGQAPSVAQPKAAATTKAEPNQPLAGPPPQDEPLQWINPTGGPIRDDKRGDGGYGKRRDGGTRSHAGVDYQGSPGDPVRAPFDGTLEIVPDGVRITQPGSKQGSRYCARMLHFDPSVSDRVQVKAGQVIGTLQDLSKIMHKDMKSHVHFEGYEIDKQGNSKRIDPTLLIPSK